MFGGLKTGGLEALVVHKFHYFGALESTPIKVYATPGALDELRRLGYQSDVGEAELMKFEDYEFRVHRLNAKSAYEVLSNGHQPVPRTPPGS
jgi:hypothetical protein